MIESNRLQFLKKKTDSKQVATVVTYNELNPEERIKNASRMLRYKRMWDAMDDFRRRRQRNKAYFNGHQWEDYITVKGKDGKMEEITEAANIMRQGKVPLKNNLICSTVNSVLGVFRQGYGKPECIARTLDNQKIGEMNTCIAEYIYQITKAKELDAKDMLEAMISGCAVQIVDYQWCHATKRNEIQFVSYNPSRLFMNGGIEDPRGNDITTIGVIMDMPKDMVVQKFARTKKEAEKIREIYKCVDKEVLTNVYRTFDKPTNWNLDFFIPKEQSLCRIIQAWDLESEECYLVHDWMNGTWEQYPLKDGAAIDQMIKERELEIEIEGLDYDECKIDKEFHNDVYWYVRYMSPLGDILFESKSPFSHESHPFSIYLGHLIDGEIHSFVENIIDQQRYINRLITLIDFIMGSSAKGVLVFPENAIPKGMDKKDILEQWTSYRGVIFANMKPGMQMPTQISTNATNIGANEMLALQMQLIRDVSGIHGAMQGKEAKSGTAASLYAQEASNAQVNIADLLESFNEFRASRDYKAVKIAPQCYSTPFFINLAGNDYSQEAHNWRPDVAASADVYINIGENNNSAVYRMMAKEVAIKAMEMGLMDLETLCDTGVFPNGERLKSVIQRRKEELQKEQAMQQAAMMQGQAQGQAMQEAGASPAEIMQAGADAALQGMEGEQSMPEQASAEQADPRAMELIRQALG